MLKTPIIEKMKSIVFLYAGFGQTHAFDSLFGSHSAFEMALKWAGRLLKAQDGSLEKIFIATNDTHLNAVKSGIDGSGLNSGVFETIVHPEWDTSSLLKEMSSACKKACADYIIYSMADSPFLNDALSLELIETHTRYAAEYSFADGYPLGLSPELLAGGSAAILSQMAKDSDSGKMPVGKNSIFSVMKSDINSFEVETVLSDIDYRMYRFDFSCSTKDRTLSCVELYKQLLADGKNHSAEEISSWAVGSAAVQRTVPAWYAIQVSGSYSSRALYNPYPIGGDQDGKVMPLDKFSSLVSNIADFSGTAVISLGTWGEPAKVHNLELYIKTVLEHPGLSLIIETEALELLPETIQKIKTIVDESAPRENGESPVQWIVSVDALSPDMYTRIHSDFSSGVKEDPFETVQKTLLLLEESFTGCVYPQFTRMTVNENELEQFYRKFHDKASLTKGHLIIQKYDSYCGLLPDLKPADLSPIERNPCWHLKRDMTVLLDGSVPLCRETVKSNIIGNVFEERLESIWKKSIPLIEEQIQRKYSGCCGKCDEFYTFNF